MAAGSTTQKSGANSGEQSQKVNREIVNEIYCALVLLGAESDLLGAVGSWGDSLPDEHVLSNIRAWNDATLKEITGRIEHYGMSSRHLACNQGEDLGNARLAH